MLQLIPISLLGLFLLLLPSSLLAFECKVCHSKKPEMVRMHKALQGRNCFDCHRMGEKLMGKGQPRDRESQLKRRASDPVCLECHQKQTQQGR